MFQGQSSENPNLDQQRLIIYTNKFKELIKKYLPETAFNNNSNSRKITLNNTRHQVCQELNDLFNVERSFQENDGNVTKLVDDFTKIYWFKFRERFPSLEDYESSRTKYMHTLYHNYQTSNTSERCYKEQIHREAKSRGLKKRILKEKKVREQLGDEEFNRRMKRDKAAKASKGGSDEQYLKYLAWRETAAAKQYLIIGEESNLVKHVDQKLTTIGISVFGAGWFTIKAENDHEFRKMVNFALMSKCAVQLTLTEGDTIDTISKQYVALKTGFLSINAAKRTSSITGMVTHFVEKQDCRHGLLISFEKLQGKWHKLFPKEWANFENYKDPVTKRFVGNPKHESRAYLLRQVRGNMMEAKIYIRETNTQIILKNYGYQPVWSYDQLVKKITAGPTENIQNRLKESILNKKNARAKENRAKENRAKQMKKPAVSSKCDKLLNLHNMLEKGLISEEEFRVFKEEL